MKREAAVFVAVLLSCIFCMSVCVCVFVFGCISLIVNVCCINRRAVRSVLSRSLSLSHVILFLLPHLLAPFCDSYHWLLLKSLLPSGRDGETASSLDVCVCACTSDQVTGLSRWCCVPEGNCDGSMTNNLKMTCLWVDKALLFME